MVQSKEIFENVEVLSGALGINLEAEDVELVAKMTNELLYAICKEAEQEAKTCKKKQISENILRKIIFRYKYPFEDLYEDHSEKSETKRNP